MPNTTQLARIQDAWPAILPIPAWRKATARPASLTGSTLTLHVSSADMAQQVAGSRARIAERASIAARRPITAVVCELSPALPDTVRRAETSRMLLPIGGSDLRLAEARLAEIETKVKDSDHPAAVLLRAAAALVGAASRSVEEERRGTDTGAQERTRELAERLSGLLTETPAAT